MPQKVERGAMTSLKLYSSNVSSYALDFSLRPLDSSVRPFVRSSVRPFLVTWTPNLVLPVMSRTLSVYFFE